VAQITNQRLAPPQQLPVGTPGVLYTVPGGGTSAVVVAVITVVNTTPTPIDVTLYLCVGGGPANDSNTLVPGPTIEGNQLVNFNFGHDIHPGDTIQGFSTALGITVHLSGIVFA